MKSQSLEPIPIPRAQRLREMRLRLLPALVMFCAVGSIALLWRQHVAAPTMVGLAESVTTEVSSHKPGLVAGLNVSRFQKVRAGDTLGHVIIADPKLIEASLTVIRSELDMLRSSLQPIVAQQRNAVDYAQLRLDWMRQRVELASARVNLQLADAEFRRTEELFKNNIASTSEMDIAKANYQALQQQVEELNRVVADGERSFTNLQAGIGADISRISSEPMQAAIAVQDARLRMTEAELSPIELRAPIDGVVTALYRRSGETVVAGQAIMTIAAESPSHIVGYLRPPLPEEPKPGMTVQLRTRSVRREVMTAQILEVGNQLEPLPLALQSPAKLASVEMGLPVDVSLPPELKIRSGEIVDITIESSAN